MVDPIWEEARAVAMMAVLAYIRAETRCYYIPPVGLVQCVRVFGPRRQPRSIIKFHLGTGAYATGAMWKLNCGGCYLKYVSLASALDCFRIQRPGSHHLNVPTAFNTARLEPCLTSGRNLSTTGHVPSLLSPRMITVMVSLQPMALHWMSSCNLMNIHGAGPTASRYILEQRSASPVDILHLRPLLPTLSAVLKRPMVITILVQTTLTGIHDL